MTSKSITHIDLHRPNNKLVSVKLEHFWCTDEPWTNTDSQDSPRPELGASHHLPPYIILCAWPQDQHPNVILSRDSQVGILKFLQLGLPQLWRPITLCVDLQLKWGLKQSCSPRQHLSNDVWNATWTQGKQGDSKLLVVRSQIGNLTPDLSYGHNLCFKCPNGSCKPNVDISIPRSF